MKRLIFTLVLIGFSTPAQAQSQSRDHALAIQNCHQDNIPLLEWPVEDLKDPSFYISPEQYRDTDPEIYQITNGQITNGNIELQAGDLKINNATNITITKKPDGTRKIESEAIKPDGC